MMTSVMHRRPFEGRHLVYFAVDGTIYILGGSYIYLEKIAKSLKEIW